MTDADVLTYRGAPIVYYDNMSGSGPAVGSCYTSKGKVRITGEETAVLEAINAIHAATEKTR